MKRMFLLLMLCGVSLAQFRLFGDSFEDDSDERVFRRPSFNSLNRFRDSDEVIFNTNRFRQQTPLNRFNRFRDSDEVIFTGDVRRPIFNRVGGFSDSDEVLFSSRPRSSFNRINRFDDSKEIFGSTRRGTFFVDSAEDIFKRTRNPIGNAARGSFFGSNGNRNPSTFNRNTFANSLNNRIKLDSVEDVFEDLFDDDLGDRLRAQNTLKRLRDRGFNFFGNRGNAQNGGVTSFQTRVGTNRFSSPPPRSDTGSTFTNNNPISHFSAATHSNTIPSSSLSPSLNRNNFGVPLSTAANQLTSPTTTNRFSQNSGNRLSSGNTFNSIRSNPFSASKRSSFPSPPGFNWPGGNGYYVSMSTGNSKPVSYFVKYDD